MRNRYALIIKWEHDNFIETNIWATIINYHCGLLNKGFSSLFCMRQNEINRLKRITKQPAPNLLFLEDNAYVIMEKRSGMFN